MTRPFALITALSAILASGSLIACEPSTPPDSLQESASLDPGFAVARAILSPDGVRLLLAGPNGAAALIALDDNSVTPFETGIDDPVWIGYAPDGSEIWISGKKNGFARFTPDGKRLPDDTVWETTAGDTQISSPQFGTLVLSQNSARSETKGRIVEHEGGKLSIDGSVYVARAPDSLVQFSDGNMRGYTDSEGAPVQGMAVACGGKCLLTAADSSSEETFYWSLAPFDPEPTRINGRVFLDGGAAALDCDGQHVLLQDESGVRRLTLPPNSENSSMIAMVTARGAKLSDEARYALIDLADYVGWHVFDAATMQPVPEPVWLNDDQMMAVPGPKGRFAVFVDAANGVRLSEIPYASIRQFDSDPEMARVRFSTLGSMVLLNDNAGVGTLYRSEDGKELGELSGEIVLFTPEDTHIVEIGERVTIYRVTD